MVIVNSLVDRILLSIIRMEGVGMSMFILEILDSNTFCCERKAFVTQIHYGIWTSGRLE